MSEALRRLPIESARPMQVFAGARLGLALLSLGIVLGLGSPYEGRLAAVILAVAVPWSLACFVLARRFPSLAVNPLVAAGDILVLVAMESAAPEAYGAVRFMALTFLAVHAHFQGERIGAVVASFAVAALVLPTALSDQVPVEGEQLVFYEAVFAGAAIATVILVGRFRTAESASRLRARELTRQTMEAEREIRRRISESLHDGPVQELIGLDMTLAAARREAEREGASGVAQMIGEASAIASRNIESLRDEILDLGPYGYDDFSFEAAVERCRPVWQRRYKLDVELELERVDLPSEVECELFKITQEAVINAAKHARADSVRIALEPTSGREVRLRVTDDGGGFDEDPLAPTEPGHIGLASMRERTELMEGRLSIDSSDAGTSVTVEVPRRPAEAARASRGRWR